MNTENIVAIETDNKNDVHLIRDRIFWQVYERSAYIFVNKFKSYQIHHKFIQKVARDLVYLGFPNTVLNDIKTMSENNNYIFENIDDSHIVIKGIPYINGFETWRASIPYQKETTETKNKVSNTNASGYLLYKLIFDFTIYYSNLVPKINKIYRFTLGNKPMDILVNICENIYLYVNKHISLNYNALLQSIIRLRLDFRILNELHQISIKQWMFINQNIENILKMIFQESQRSRMLGA